MAIAAVASASAVAIGTAPRAATGAFVVLLLMLPITLLGSAACASVLRHLPATARLLALPEATALAAFTAGFVASNLAFSAAPASMPTVVAVAVSAIVALLARRALRGLTAPPWFTAAFLGVLVLALDLWLFPRHLRVGHVVGTGIASLLFDVSALLALRSVAGSLAAPAITSLLVVAVATAGVDSLALRRTADEPALAARLVAAYRRVLDRDGDGFSRSLGGGDCDDADPRVYPLSLQGRDCLGFVPGPAPASAAHRERSDFAVPATLVRAPEAPERIVLVTIDALRCGLSGDDRFARACPELLQLASTGLHRADAFAVAPSSRPSIHAMFTGTLHRHEHRRDGFFVTRALTAAGYRATAVLSHDVLDQIRGLDAAFDVVDRSLARRASELDAAIDEALVDRALAQLDRADRDGVPVFTWVHLIGPHAPYVTRDGGLFVGLRDAGYESEVRRTDRAAARLVRRALAGPRGERTVVVVTADHGEAFGEHASYRHSMTLFEAEVRVPVMVLGTRLRRVASAPRSLVELPRLFGALVEDRPFAPEHVQLLRFGNAIALRSGRYKLLYELDAARISLFDVEADPDELRDLADAQPDVVRRLGHELGARLRALPD